MALFRRPTVRYGRTPEPETPYQRAAQVWDDRIGSARVQAKNWRLMAFGSLALSMGLAGGLVWQSTHGTIVPWVVQVDKLGQAQAVAPATADYTPERSADRLVSRPLHRDGPRRCRPIRSSCGRTGCRPTTSPPPRARQALNDYARANDPFAKLGKQQIAIDVSSVIRASPSSFRVAWVEHRYQDGALADNTRWTAILTVAIQTPTSADVLRKNPLGIYVTAINWSKELGQ